MAIRILEKIQTHHWVIIGVLASIVALCVLQTVG
jgi:hypothetical protein